MRDGFGHASCGGRALPTGRRKPLSLSASTGGDMGILDEAIREHLELKRQHGAGDSELQQIEDEAFGPPARPDEFEQPLPQAEEQAPASDAVAEAPTTHMPAPAAEAPVPEAAVPPPVVPEEPASQAPPPPAPEPAVEPEPVAEEHPAAEHEIVSEPPPPPMDEAPPPSIVEEPTQHYDVLEGEVVSEEPTEGPVDEGFEVEEAEAEPLADEEEEETQFFDEQSLSDELDQALDAPVEEEEAAPPVEEEAAPPAEEAEPAAEDEAPPAKEGGRFYDQDDDVLEETPEFLQDTPESDRLWFEQKPPKDFDFDG